MAHSVPMAPHSVCVPFFVYCPMAYWFLWIPAPGPMCAYILVRAPVSAKPLACLRLHDTDKTLRGLGSSSFHILSPSGIRYTCQVLRGDVGEDYAGFEDMAAGFSVPAQSHATCRVWSCPNSQTWKRPRDRKERHSRMVSGGVLPAANCPRGPSLSVPGAFPNDSHRASLGVRQRKKEIMIGLLRPSDFSLMYELMMIAWR